MGGDNIDYLKCFSKITGINIPENVSIIRCPDDKAFIAAVDEWGKRCKVPMSTIRASTKARGVYFYSVSASDAPSAVIVNDARVFREKDKFSSVEYTTDLIIFHELGHCVTKDKLKRIYVDSKRELFPALVLKESFACYYSYLCLSNLYSIYDESDDLKSEIVDDLNFFVDCAKESVSCYSKEDGYSFLLSPTDIGNIVGQILVNCKPFIDALDENAKNDVFSSCSDPAFAQKLYNFSCEHLQLLSQESINPDQISDYCKKFDIIFSTSE